MKYTIKEIAEMFSNGKFEDIYEYIHENATWEVVGESFTDGKSEIIKQCNGVADYFKTVETDFKKQNTIEENNRVAVNGTAQFLRDGKTITFVSACDVYEFNNDNMIEKITSYCISKRV